jgi:hypothetical protein
MSAVQIPISESNIKNIKRALRKPNSRLICSNPQAYLQAMLVAQQMLYDGDNVKAKITKGYEEL